MIPEEGTVIGRRYLLGSQIGEGATGAVWRATQTDLDRPVAVKLLHPNIVGKPDARLRFVREARVAAALHHAGAVQVLDYGDHEGTPFLVMELLSGMTLRERLDEGLPSLDLAVHISLQIAEVLEAAHAIGLVHRDIKPENVFLQADGEYPRVRVVDFGLAFIVDSGESVGRLTDLGIVGGTPSYMSPEQARGKVVGPPSDVYSLGCTLYELVTSRPPFLGTPVEVMTKHGFAPAIALHDLQLARPVPRLLDELVTEMLSKAPPLRPTAARVAARLEEVLARGLGGTADSLRAHARSSRVPPRPVVPSIAAIGASDDEQTLALGVVGEVDDDMRLVLAANGIRVTRGDDPAAGAVFVRTGHESPSPATKPVVVEVDPTDVAGVVQAIRAGAHDAVATPARADDLARKLLRLARETQT